MSATYETAIAAAATAVPQKHIRQEMSRVLGDLVRPASRRHKLRFREVLYFKLKASLEQEGFQLSRKDRQTLFLVLASRNAQSGEWQRRGQTLERTGEVSIVIQMNNIVRTTRQSLKLLQRASAYVESNPAICGGVPVFKGTRIPEVQIIEQFRAGVPAEEIREDYPALSEAALRYAELRSRMGRAPGRPSKALTLQRTAVEATH